MGSNRTWVVTGRERHVAAARDGFLPYPHRAIRTRDFLYVRNFALDCWPMGSPGPALEQGRAPALDAVEQDTFVAFADMDASPTKRWLIAHRDEERWRWHWECAFGLRPAEELYDLRRDADQVRHVADAPAYAEVRKELADRLMAVLREAEAPRVIGDGTAFDRPQFAGLPEPADRVTAKPKS